MKSPYHEKIKEVVAKVKSDVLIGCGDWACHVQEPEKMGAVGGCRCSRPTLEKALRKLRRQNKTMLSLLEKLANSEQ